MTTTPRVTSRSSARSILNEAATCVLPVSHQLRMPSELSLLRGWHARERSISVAMACTSLSSPADVCTGRPRRVLRLATSQVICHEGGGEFGCSGGGCFLFVFSGVGCFFFFFFVVFVVCWFCFFFWWGVFVFVCCCVFFVCW